MQLQTECAGKVIHTNRLVIPHVIQYKPKLFGNGAFSENGPVFFLYSQNLSLITSISREI